MTFSTMAAETMTGEPQVARPGDETLVCRAEGELRGASPRHRCLEGVRFTDELAATVSAGPFAGRRLSGLDQFTVRPDGSLVMAGAQLIESTGEPVSLELRASVIGDAHSARPDSDTMAARGYDFPDIDLRLTGSALIHTADPRYRHLDGVMASVEGWVNFESGEVSMEARALGA